MRREGYGPLRSGATSTRCFASHPERRINIDGVNQGLVSMNQGLGISGTDSGASVAINVPVARLHSISGKLRVRHHGISDGASHSVILGVV
jgi:hypothetical protein